MKLRRLNDEGIVRFRDFLRQCRERPNTELPFELLERQSVTELVEPRINIAVEYFETKGNAAQYLDAILKPLKRTTSGGMLASGHG